MPILNTDKSYAQQPMRLDVDADMVIPDDWFARLGDLVSGILELNPEDKTAWVHRLNRHAGANATYNFKAQLLDSLKITYVKLVSIEMPSDQKTSVSVKLAEGSDNECTPGFHDRVNELLESFIKPKNLDELLQVQRQWLVVRAAAQLIDEIKAQGRSIE